MAIGAIFNSLIYGGVDSADYGVYITGDAVFNAPKRSVELVSVPGRNGAIELDQGHFENIEVSYLAGMFGDDQTDFRERLSDFRNAIMSQKGYQRLSDTYHPDEFRMGIYVDGLEVEPKHYNEAGQFTLRFNCKPQRFLTSGEEVITIGEWEDYETVTGDKVTFEADDTTKIKDIKTDINPKQDGTPTRNTETGSIVSFDAISATRIHNVSAEIVPVQDLHGYDKPWAGGNGKNLMPLPPSASNAGLTFTANSDGTMTVNGTSTGYSFTEIFGTLSAGTYRVIGANDIAGLYVQVRNRATDAYITNQWDNNGVFTLSQDLEVKFRVCATVSGTSLNNYNLKPMVCLNSESDKSFAPYSNICPISGWDEAEVSRTGFNVWDEEWELGIINQNTGQNEASSVQIRTKNYMPVIDANYYLTVTSEQGSNTNISARFYDADKNYIGSLNAAGERTFYNSVFRPPANARYMRWNMQASYGTTYNHDICINISKTTGTPKNGDYVAYNGNTYTIDLGGTRYGGTLDVTSGVLTVTHKQVTYDGSETWRSSNSGMRVYTTAPADAKKNASTTTKVGAICNAFVEATPSDTYAGRAIGFAIENVSSQGDVYFCQTGQQTMTVDGWKAYLQSNPTTVVYPLAEPLTVQLTPRQLSALMGQNNIWVNTGDVTIDYGNVYPISEYFDIDIYHSSTPDSADATEYEIDTGTVGRVFGGVLDVTAGKLLVTDKNINYYDGETLPSTWISDRDQYAPGTTPSIGAQVVYKLASPEEYDVTPTQIDALIGSNYIWSNSGDVTVEYGWNPNIITNPTLFDARPLLMVEGYGNIEMNGKEIELKRVVIGNVSIAGAETKQFGTSITMEIGFNPEQFNTGDAISVNPFVFASDYYYELYGDELTLYTATDQLQGAQTTFQKEGASYYKIQTAWPALTFYVGTDAEYTNEAIITGEAGGQGFLNQRLNTKVELSHRSSTYAVIKFTFNSGSMYEDLYVIATERKLILNGINGDSTLLTLGHPTYIDCDLGEAYMIKNGAVISLNAYIDLGSDLPSLGPGLNRIDFDNTITELKLRPDWWKV